MPGRGKRKADPLAGSANGSVQKKTKSEGSMQCSDGKNGLSERRLKQYSVGKSGRVPLTVGITGARADDVLRGVEEASSGDVANVVLRIHSGVVSAPSIIRRSVEAEVGRDALVETVAKHFSISKAQAELRYDDFPTTEAPNHQPLGSGCCHGIEEECNCPPAATFVIVCQGVWQSFAEQHGHGSEMQAMVEERRVVCWRDVLQLMYTPGLPEGKKLILRPRLFELVAGPQILSVVDEKEDVLDVVKIFGGEGPALMLRLSGRVMRVPCGSSRAYQVDVETIREAVKGLVVGTDEQLHHCLTQLQPLSLGALKSSLQKVIRFHAKDVLVEGKLIPAPVVAAASAALLFASKGGFSPELQLFTRGATAAFKRLAVILLEDAWIEEDNMASSLEGLLALGLVTQQMNDYEPSHHLIISSMRIAAKAAMSCSLIAWRKGKQGPSSIKVLECEARSFQTSAQLLRDLRSFAGDMQMFDQVSESSKSGKLEMLHAHGRPDIMPLCHIVDQHTFRGVGHVLGAGSGATFADRFHLLFDQCTGCNPRFSDLAGFESRPEVQRARFAQNCCLNFALQKPRNALPLISDGTPVSLELDTGVLAAGVGPISVHVNAGSKRKKELLVLLGLRCPEDEVVMLKPVRATRDLFGELTEKERADAVTLARSHSHRVVSPLLPSSKEAQFRDGMWEVDGCKWADLVSQGVKVKIPLVCPPRWCDDLLKNPSRVCDLLDDDGALEDALRSTGAGMIADSDKIVMCMTCSLPHGISLRAVALLRQQYACISMPTPSLQGGLVSDQLAAYDGDWKVYRLLALISRLVPAALRPTMPPNFQVVNSILLRVVEKWMMEGIQSRPADLHLPRSVGLETVGRWEEVQKCLEQVAELMEHQREAIHCMVQRDEDLKCGGHFLIMDTGHGKTVTALVYAFRWLCQHGQTQHQYVQQQHQMVHTISNADGTVSLIQVDASGAVSTLSDATTSQTEATQAVATLAEVAAATQVEVTLPHPGQNEAVTIDQSELSHTEAIAQAAVATLAEATLAEGGQIVLPEHAAAAAAALANVQDNMNTSNMVTIPVQAAASLMQIQTHHLPVSTHSQYMTASVPQVAMAPHSIIQTVTTTSMGHEVHTQIVDTCEGVPVATQAVEVVTLENAQDPMN